MNLEGLCQTTIQIPVDMINPEYLKNDRIFFDYLDASVDRIRKHIIRDEFISAEGIFRIFKIRPFVNMPTLIINGVEDYDVDFDESGEPQHIWLYLYYGFDFPEPVWSSRPIPKKKIIRTVPKAPKEKDEETPEKDTDKEDIREEAQKNDGSDD